jgi:sterol desaturase/sphingolipid hydroxylase (fatty acid hydroxylase superfamily)
LLAIDTMLVRLLAPGAVVGVALLAEDRGWGLFNAVALPPWAGVVLAVMLLDLLVYFQHVMFHAVPALWRLHRVHHADLDFDLTTGIRFHPIEILASLGIKSAAVAAMGAPAIAVLVFEVLLNGTAMFNHANASLPPRFERWVRWIVVTPDMHRVHHSVRYEESSSNFGFSLPWWDRLFGTYRAQPRAGHDAMTIGVDAFRDPRELRLDRLLAQPFRDTPGQYPINRRPGAA